ncbi:MAG: PIN domain nuclease [Acidobacteria bacterium]|nr:PIN domain nuclease [Acidobacteriota bacterium]
MVFARALFFVSSVAIGFLGYPGGLPGLVVGVLLAIAVIALEVKLHTIHPNALMGGIVGTSIGLVLAIGFGIAARQLDLTTTQEAVIQGVVLLALAYLGMIIGAIKGRQGEWWLPWKRFVDRGLVAGPTEKILDTSVIIDGRIRELVDAGFIEGALVVPQFVLHELQLVADSNDALKRARGRRGLDILKGLQDESDAQVTIDSVDFPNVREVDDKLVELALKRHAPVMTNDYNLAKVAQVRGARILNINELANSLKPAFLPGETMSIYIVRDGTEEGQGVGYLDDGTMVVVDGAQENRGQTVGMEVTSVLQTSAGKMVFGKRTHVAASPGDAPTDAVVSGAR